MAAPVPLVASAPAPAPTTNGTVWALAHAGGVVYVGGTFTSITPPGGRPVPRHNLAAVDARTGAVLPWAPQPSAPTFRPLPGHRPDVACDVDWGRVTQVCTTVYELRVAAGRLYAAGDFQEMNGQPRSRIAAFNLSTGALDGAFRPSGINARVRALAAAPGVLFAGGLFTTVGGKPRAHVAALSLTSGAVHDWAPDVDGPVWAMTHTRGKLIVGGQFDRLAGVPVHGLGALDPARPVAAPWVWRGLPARSSITDLVNDGASVYASSEGEGTFDGTLALDAVTGRLRWSNDCRGATWSLTILAGVLYAGSHAHNCAAVGGFGEKSPRQYHRLLAQPTHPAGEAPRLLGWYPTTNGGDYALPRERTPSRLGPRVMVAAAGCVWVGGQFTTVNDAPQRALTRFCP